MDELNWLKSSYSSANGGNCVEVAWLTDELVAIRDSKNPDGGHLTVSAGAFHEFLSRIVADKT